MRLRLVPVVVVDALLGATLGRLLLHRPALGVALGGLDRLGTLDVDGVIGALGRIGLLGLCHCRLRVVVVVIVLVITVLVIVIVIVIVLGRGAVGGLLLGALAAGHALAAGLGRLLAGAAGGPA